MTDPQIEAHDEPDLEAQVEGLLSEVMETVEEIHRKLGEPPAEPDAIDPNAPVGDDGAAEPDAEPDPEPESELEAALEAALGEPSADAIDERPEPDAVPGIDEVQAALEAAIAEEATVEEPAPHDEIPDEIEAADALDAPDAINEPAPVDTGYADADALDDELAALASLNPEEPGDGVAEPEPEPEPVSAYAPDPGAPIEAPESFDAATPDEPELQPEPEGEPVASIPDPFGSPAPAPSVQASPEAGDTAGLRWGWLPPKPSWEEVYSRWRPVIIACRYIAWIVPPLAGLLAGRVLARAKAMEPSVRHAVAVAASPLSRRDARVRSAVGYLAVWTLFWSVCIWIYVLRLRTADTPPTDETPTRLVGERPASNPRN